MQIVCTSLQTDNHTSTSPNVEVKPTVLLPSRISHTAVHRQKLGFSIGYVGLGLVLGLGLGLVSVVLVEISRRPVAVWPVRDGFTKHSLQTSAYILSLYSV